MRRFIPERSVGSPIKAMAFLTRSLRFSAVIAALLSAPSCTKVEPNTPLSCRVANGGIGVGGIANPRTIMFWADPTLASGQLHLVSIRNTETNGTFYGRSSAADMMRYFATRPTCGTYGPVTAQVSKGYEYEYTFDCASGQLQGKVTVDCSSDDCIAIQLR
jgi:hypothetical protein